jgi:hypothetical protein
VNHEIHERHEKILFKEESYLIEGAIFEVYREMGVDFWKRFTRSVCKGN